MNEKIIEIYNEIRPLLERMEVIQLTQFESENDWFSIIIANDFGDFQYHVMCYDSEFPEEYDIELIKETLAESRNRRDILVNKFLKLQGSVS